MTTTREFDATALMQFRCGFDSLSGEVLGTIVTGTVPNDFTGGQEVLFSLQKVESIEDFIEAMNVKASVSLQAQFGRGGTKAQFIRTLKVHDYSVYIAAKVTVLCGTKILQSPVLPQDAADMLTSDENKKQFRKMYGDEFLAGITSGGEFIAILEIRTSNQTEYEEVKAKVTASGWGGAVSGSASFRSFMEEIVQTYEFDIKFHQRGGAVTTAPLTPESLVEKAANFAPSVTGANAFDYLATFQSYDILPRPAGHNPIDIQNQRESLERLARQRLRAQQALDSIEYVLANPEQFEAFDQQTLMESYTSLAGWLNDVMDAASRCFNNISMCDILPSASPSYTLPKRRGRSAVDAIAVVKEATERAIGHAEQCMAYSGQIIELNRAIETGPNGKQLADQAKGLAAELAEALKLVDQAVDDALSVAYVNEEVNGWKRRAREVLSQARDADAIARQQYSQAYATGYAPYWHAPTRLHLRKYVRIAALHPRLPPGHCLGWGSVVIYVRPPIGRIVGAPSPVYLSDLAIDPTGGELDILPACASPGDHNGSKVCPIEDWPYWGRMLKNEMTSGVSISDYGVSVGVSGEADNSNPTGDMAFLTGRSFFGSFIIRSRQTGLRTKVRLKFVCDDGSNSGEDYLDTDLQVVRIGTTPSTHGIPLGWATRPTERDLVSDASTSADKSTAETEERLNQSVRFSRGKLGRSADKNRL